MKLSKKSMNGEMMNEPKLTINTVKSGVEYRVKVDGRSIHMIYDPDNEVVWLSTRTANLGGYNLSRFNGTLNPSGIRFFFSEGKSQGEA